MKKEKVLILTIMLLAIGFAAVGTTLFINGGVKISSNGEDLDVYFSKVKIDGVEDNSAISSSKNITYTKTFKTLGEELSLEYSITNNSSNYDGKVRMECNAGNDYLQLTNSWVDDTIIEAKTTEVGTLKVKLVKVFAASTIDDPDEITTNFSCTINVEAIERTESGTGTVPGKVKDVVLTKASGNTATTAEVGDIVTIKHSLDEAYTEDEYSGEEQFYVISNDGTNINMLSKYNLLTGISYVDENEYFAYGVMPGLNLQRSDMIGSEYVGESGEGIVKWTEYNEDYSEELATDIPLNVVNDYVRLLNNYNPSLHATGRLITVDELNALGCEQEYEDDPTLGTCVNAPDWVSNTSYWIGTRDTFRTEAPGNPMHITRGSGRYTYELYQDAPGFGVRPVLTISASLLN